AEVEHGERVVAAVRQPQRDGDVRAWHRGAQAIRDRLVVERPARLLAVVRDGDVPQRRLHSACHTDWSVGTITYHKHMAPRAATRSPARARVDRRRRIARVERRDARQELLRAALGRALTARAGTLGAGQIGIEPERVATAIMALSIGLAQQALVDARAVPDDLLGETIVLIYRGLLARAEESGAADSPHA